MQILQGSEIESKLFTFMEHVSRYATEEEKAELRRTFDKSLKINDKKIWFDGTSYILHSLDTAISLAEMQQDIPTLKAALLHDCVDLGNAERIGSDEGNEVYSLLKGMERLHTFESMTLSLEQTDNLRRMMISEAGDLRTIILHLSDHRQMMENIEKFPDNRKERIIQLSEKVYAPLAGRLGIHRIKSLLEDLVLKYTKPDVYEEIVRELSKTKIERQKYIENVIGVIHSLLEEKGIEAKVYGRVKHIASIYNKMKRQGVTLSGIYDVIAFRIIVPTEQKCWETLGLILGKWPPIAGRFRDYISQPKKNGYRSLHLSVIGPYKERMEIQIRTHEMHRIAEEGIAAHWRYKEGGKKISQLEEKQIKWITSSISGDETTEKLFEPPQEIYVFTPNGDVIALPAGATPLDFAYAIHTSLGHSTTAAIVNGKAVSLSYELKSGDIVKIITRKGAHPSKDWLEIAKTHRARTKIRSYFNTEERKEMAQRGREVLEKFLQKHSISLNKMEKKGKLKNIVNVFKCTNLNELYIRIASNKITPEQVLEIISPEEEKKKQEIVEEKFIEGMVRNSAQIKLGDIRNLLVRFAGCCRPIPGDRIMGFVTRGRGITIHRSSCPFLLASDVERRVPISWETDSETVAVTGLKILTEPKGGILAKLTQLISGRGFNVISAKTEKREDGNVLNLLTFEIKGTRELQELINALEKVSEVERF